MRRGKAVMLVVGVALVFALLETIQTYLRRYVSWGKDGFGVMFLLMLQPWLTFAALSPLPIVLARRYPVGGRRRALAVHAAAALVFPVAHSTLLTLLSQALFGWHDFARSVARLLCAYFVTDIMIYAAIAGVAMVVAAARLRASLAEARLTALRGQLHPHFLFNVMNTVAMLVREGKPEAALEVLAELGVLLRALLRDAGGHEVPLAAEIEFNRRYLELERVRFGDRLSVSFDCAGGVERALVPHLVLQPLVENAVRHGIARVAGPGSIRVLAARRGAELSLEVWNDGPPPAMPSPAGGGAGLRLTRERLAGLYGARQAMTLEAAPEGGALARVTFPYHTAPLEAAT